MRVRSPTALLAQEAAKANTACTAMYNPGTLNDSNMISAVYSLFSGVFSGGSVYKSQITHKSTWKRYGGKP